MLKKNKPVTNIPIEVSIWGVLPKNDHPFENGFAFLEPRKNAKTDHSPNIDSPGRSGIPMEKICQIIDSAIPSFRLGFSHYPLVN